MSDVISDASLRLAGPSSPQRGFSAIFSRTFALLLAIIFALILLGGCAGSEGKKDDTDIWPEAKLYSEATDKMNDADFAKCGKYFEKLEARFPFGPYSQQAQINSAYCYWKAQEQAQALIAIDRFIKLHQGSPTLDYAYYLKGLITFNDDLGWLGNFTGQDLSERDPKAAKEAFESFKTVVDRFPDSKYAPDSLDRMRYIVNSLAEADVNVARFYYQRGAYLASANRAQLVIRDYDRAPAVEEALYILVKSYEKLGLTQLSNDSARVFALNFPDSTMLETGQRVKKEVKWWQFWNK
ncbi:outer membrane protein assembly factor BamD [Polynucleobacter asymbioticus]|jgi:outer membrane protein assembly factor BamD|uniref:Outer membrane protein assembly factor BamD n=2 Tax=Polynucleobacter asymbioticus TaxID=576611 RepID=A4SXC2_POLAQ|nr:outer membrane protein assembly factor BamD [Polynucleobacter asymbioticus]ABP34136.1 putative transmembrane protein [Polynucleobacter asymbioticus QLW-P1DMWA-1]APC00042.1 competence protein ComL [Polynucleobacter asymbioticus]APC02346.1 competence protein ComL [Polynucleobacter asymbioticus]APC07121.1 competence protein ComL [Polynucleobacter asymbioticus]